MKSQLQTVFFLFIFSVRASAQPAAVKINPATGLPDNGSPSQRIDPATGLPQSNLYDELRKARALMKQGQYEDSLGAITNYFEQSRFDPDQAGSRLFSIMDWGELGRRYPRVKQALLELRDTDSQKLLSGEGDFIYFAEVNVINQDLGNAEASYTLFKAIERLDPRLAGQCYAFVEDQLVQKGEYETCRKYLGDPVSDFQSDLKVYHIEMENQVRVMGIRQKTQQQMQEFYRQHPNIPHYTPPDNSQMFEKMAKDRFVAKVRQLIEILVGIGDKAEAEKIQKMGLDVLDDPRLETAVADAGEKIIQNGRGASRP